MQYKTANGYMNYNDFVRALCKPGNDIVREITPADANMMHMAIGISGEAGELLDAIKKAVIYRKPLDIYNVREECGDLLFYITGMLEAIGSNIDEVIQENVDKLSLRYQSLSFSNHAAIQRADKDHGSEIKGQEPEADEDFDEVIPRACSMDEECESCQ